MDCPACGGPTEAFAVPAAYREFLPGKERGAALCTRCLRLHPVEEAPEGGPDLASISDVLPADGDAAVPLALLLGLLENLALYRSEIDELLADVERAGVDPLLALDRLAAAPEVEAAADLPSRRRQLEQLL